MPSKIVLECSKAIVNHKLTIAFAESATAGRLSAEFAMVPDSGKILKGGLVCYDANIKKDILGVPAELINRYTPESAEVTKELAHRFKTFMDADIVVAVTGLTTAGGSESPQKPVGTIFIYALVKDKQISIRKTFSGSPEEIILKAIDQVALLIVNELKAHQSIISS